MTQPFRLTAPVPREYDIHTACADALNKLLKEPAVWFSYPAGASTLTPQQHARHSAIGLKRGLPDIWVLHHGVYCIELKRPGGTLSRTRIVRTRRGSPRELIGQVDMFPRLLLSGAVKEIAVCHSVAEVLQQLEQWQVPLWGRIAA